MSLFVQGGAAGHLRTFTVDRRTLSLAKKAVFND